MKKRFLSTACLAALLLLFSFAAAETDSQLSAPIESISAAFTQVQLQPGEALPLQLSFQPENAELCYSFCPEGIAYLDEEYNLHGITCGETELIIQGVSGGESLSLSITVKDIGYSPLSFSQQKTDLLPEAETFVYGKSEMGRDLLCTRIGESDAAQKILLQFCIHGFEDSYARDGLLLVQIAQSLITLLAEELPEGSAVYVIPCGNPDGLISGNTHNGFGRCNALGLDINRDFPVRWAASSQKRNLTGETPFSSREAQALRELLLGLEPSFTIDVHGYTSCIYGEGSRAKLLGSALSLPVYQEKGGGMFFQWAREQFGDAVLIELPKREKLGSSSYVKQYSQKLETALLRLLSELPADALPSS